jgi:hypothetical protein
MIGGEGALPHDRLLPPAFPMDFPIIHTTDELIWSVETLKKLGVNLGTDIFGHQARWSTTQTRR